jgi:hypothetical protein
MEEFWVDVSGFEDIYAVSTLGRLRCQDLEGYRQRHRKIAREPGILPVVTRRSGYQQVLLKILKTGRYATREVHGLVAEAFLGPRMGRVVNHKDGNKANNILSNLEYVSPRENMNHALPVGVSGYRGVQKRGEKWRATISVNRKRIFLGSFPTAELAAEAYSAKARLLSESKYVTKRHSA